MLLNALTESVSGQTINVGSEGDLNNAIQTINANAAAVGSATYTLNFTSGFSLNQPVLDIATPANVTILGNSMTIDGANLYQPLIIDSGAVTVQSLNIVNSGQPIKVKGGILIDATGSLKGLITDNGQLQFTQTTAETFTGSISGTGSVAILGAGPVTFSTTNTYTGGTLVGPGATLIGTTTTMPTAIIDVGNVQFNQATAGTYAGVIFGIGHVEISGTGPVTFTGLNHYLGGTIVDAGSTLIGSTSSLQGTFDNRGALQFHQATSGTFGGSVSGAGSVEINGGGPVTFSGANTYMGGTIVDTGNTLIGTTTSLQGAMNNQGAIQFNQTMTGVYSGNLSGSGSVEIMGGGSVVFSGLNNYTGGTTIDSGNTLSGTGNSLRGDIVNNGAAVFISGGMGPYNGNMSGTGRVEIAANATATFIGSNSYSGGTTVDDGATLIGTTGSVHGTSLSLQGVIYDNGLVIFNTLVPVVFVPYVGGAVIPHPDDIANARFDGNITGTGRVEIGGGGTTEFTGANYYLGGTTVDSGSTLRGCTDSVQGNITNNGFVQFRNDHLPPIFPHGSLHVQQFPLVYAGNMTGTGGVEISGAAPIWFTGTNSYTGGTIVDAGSTLIGSTRGVQGNISNNGIVMFSQYSGGAYAGNMSGTGSVTINGGSVTFSGINSYTGGTTVMSSSTLIGTTSSLQGTMFDSGLIQFNQSNSGTYAGVISGTGSVEISGLGSATFSNANLYTGGTTIDNGGTLIVTGSILGDVNVNNGGTLMGTGTVGNTAVNAGGTITPGSVGAPLTINGNFVQGSGSTYNANVNSTGSTKIVVSGTAQISGATKLNVTVDPGTLTVGKKYELLSAAGGLTGQYATVFTPTLAQHVIFTEQYGSNKLQLVVNSNLAQFVQSSNQLAVASVLDQSSGSATGGFANALTQLTTLGPGQLSAALNQLSGDIYGSLSTIERQTTTVQMQLLSSRLATLSAPGLSSPSVAQRMNGVRLVSRQASDDQPSNAITNGPSGSPNWTTWAQGYGLGGSVAGDSNAGGVNYRLGGTLFGTERWLSDKFMVGVLGGYAGTSIGNRQEGSNAQINAFQVGLYELYRQDSLYISNIDAYSNSSYNVSRPLDIGSFQQTATGNSSGNQWAHYTESGLTYEVDDFRIQPFLGVQYMYLDQKGYTESGAGSLDLTTSQQIVNSVRNSIGARVYHEATWGNILVIPSLSARYQHEWGNGTQLISSSFSGAPTSQFVTAGNHTGRDFGLFTLSATAYLTPRFNLYGSVDTQVAANYSAVIGSGGLQYFW